MPSAVSPNSRPPPQDDLDALFDSDVELDQIRNSANRENKDAADNDKPTTSNLDEEIVITKKRQPIAKLDEERYAYSKLYRANFSHSQDSVCERHTTASNHIKKDAIQGQRTRSAYYKNQGHAALTHGSFRTCQGFSTCINYGWMISIQEPNLLMVWL